MHARFGTWHLPAIDELGNPVVALGPVDDGRDLQHAVVRGHPVVVVSVIKILRWVGLRWFGGVGWRGDYLGMSDTSMTVLSLGMPLVPFE